MTTLLKKAAVGMAFWAAIAGPVCADQLADVKARGTLVCGVMSTSEPFGYSDPKARSVVGYDVDFCNAIAKRLGVKPELKPVATDARIPELQQGRMDILVAALGYTAKRAEQIDYSHAYYFSQHRLAVNVDKGFTSRNDLAGKRISFQKGGTAEAFARASLPGAVLVGYEDIPTAFTALTQNKVDAFSVPSEQARRLISKLGPAASQYKLLEPPVGQETWGIGVRKGEPGMLKAVNDALTAIEASGEAQQVFDTWLGPSTMYKLNRSFKVEPIQR